MSLQTDTFLLCKSIIQSNVRNDFQKFYEKLQQDSPSTFNPLMGLMSNLLKAGKHQFLNLILEIKKIETIPHLKENLFKIINQNELALLINLNNFILHINDRCLKSLQELNHNFFKSVHPYSDYEYRFEGTKTEIFDSLLNENKMLVDNIVHSFNNHTVFRRFESYFTNYNDTIKNYPSDYWMAGIKKYTKLIHKKGLFEMPQELLTGYSEHPHLIREILFSLISLRSSIEVLNQLIFQSFLHDKLKIINEENTFEIKKSTHFDIGESIEIFCDWTNFDGFSIVPKEVVKMNLKTQYGHYDGIYLVVNCNSIFSKDEGCIIDIIMRKIDDDLSFLFN